MGNAKNKIELDIIVRDAGVIDGSGGKSYRSDVGVRRGRIAALGDLSRARSRRTIRAPGCFLAPGFIDIHSHSDYSLLIDPRAESKVRQGVTTEAVGNCGSSAAPLYGMKRARAKVQNRSLSIDWFTLGGYRRRLAEEGTAVNVAALTGHGNLRGSVIGYDSRPASRVEMKRMLSLLDKSLEEGSRGLSTGLIYPPGIYAGFRELRDLAALAARRGGIYTTHMRSESAGVEEAVAEAIRVAETAGVSLQISHLKTQGRKNWHRIDGCFRRIESARSRGVDVHCDRYPYTASSTDLDILLPDWTYEGGPDAEISRLSDPRLRDRIKRGIVWTDWKAAVISRLSGKKNRWMEGKSLAQVARRRRQSPSDCLLDILKEEKLGIEALFFSMSEENLRRILSRPYCMVGSDASAKSTRGPLSGGKPHPRAFGAFPRALREFAGRGILSWEEAVHKMTGLPAYKLGLLDRGAIRTGAAADLVVFDPKTIADRATYAEPHRYPDGIEYVIVNGEIVVEKGRHTGRLPGKFLA
jgi:N-acyl-D-amino-acid deacylase